MPNKWRNTRCREQYRDCPYGHESLREHRRWVELDLLEKAGHIRDLRQQVAYELAPPVMLFGRKKPALRYIADFVYVKLTRDTAGRVVEAYPVVEDCKGAHTESFRIKAHLMVAIHGVEIKLS